MMEKYAYNLEEIVEERTQQVEEEKKKTDRLLYRMLPALVRLLSYIHKIILLPKVHVYFTAAFIEMETLT